MKTHLRPLVVALLVVASFASRAALGAEAITPDLKKISQGVGATLAKGVTARWDTEVKGKDALFCTGAVWLEGVAFSEGTIECDILGQSLPRGSNFPGIAFHGVDDTTFECVYFRPFNFRTELPESVVHAVQYISAPQWPWQKLRAEKTGQYEKPIVPAPDGDAWFHAKIVVAGKKVSVFVNGAEKPSLEIEALSERTNGRVAIWGGDAGVGGRFANLKITPAASSGGATTK